MPEKLSVIDPLTGKTVFENKIPRKKNDELLKGAFEDHFMDFLRFVYPDAEDVLDFSKAPEFMDKELFSIAPDRERKNDQREADLLAKLYLKNGTEKWIFLNVEIEGSNDPELSLRLFEYYYRIRERYNVSVATIAVFIGDENQRRPNHYGEELLGTVLSFKYTTYHVFDHTKEVLLANANPFALIVLACQKALLEDKMGDKELNEERLTILRALISRGYNRNRIVGFAAFLKNFIFIKDKRINSIFDKEIVKLTGGKVKMGIMEVLKMQAIREGHEQGLEQGLEAGREQGLEQALEEKKEIARNFKNLGVPIADIAKGIGLSVEEIESL